MSLHVEDRRTADEPQAALRVRIQRLMREYDRAPAGEADALDVSLLKLLKGAAPSVRAEAAAWLAGIRTCPPRSVRSLACDSDPHVAAAVLRRSAVLCERTLTEMALCKGQAHLEALAARKNLPESVTRVLIRRGDRLVLEALARNKSAIVAPACRRRLLARLGERDATPRRVRPRAPRLGPAAPASA